MRRDRLAILDAVGGFRPNCNCGLCRDFARTQLGVDPGAVGGDMTVVFIVYPDGNIDIVDTRDLYKTQTVVPEKAEASCKPGGIIRVNAPGEVVFARRDESAQRKATPIYSGVLRYFPDALAAVARLSKAGNDKHNPGQPLHWAREKSTDHGDCIVRHQLTPDQIDPETGELHATAVAWRALAQLQLLEEARQQKVAA